MAKVLSKIYYKSGYKYQLVKDFATLVNIQPPEFIKTDFIELTTYGMILIKAGYAWDGASWPAIDTKDAMKGSLFHDACYQLLREGLLDAKWRDQADQELRRICINDGMSKIRAAIWCWAVRMFAGSFADPANKKPVLEAP